MTAPFDCPRCAAPLAMSERQGIEIDYYPRCRGVWLDRGELDKIIERVGQPPAPLPQSPPPQPSAWMTPAPQHRPPPQGWAHGKGGHHGRRKSWLKEIFD